jgi:hypothetical protein
MSSVTRLARLVRIVTLPETRGLIVAVAHSETLRDIGQRAVIRPRRGVTIWARGTHPLPALRRLRYPGGLLVRDTARGTARDRAITP